MFPVDPKLQARIKQRMSRVLIIEENHAYARMLADMIRMLGADQIVIEADGRRAMHMLTDFDAQLIVTEYKGVYIDGIEFTRALRHSESRSKAVPVIMVKADITQAQLTEARNCGIHEVMMKPFAWQDLLTRLQNVLFKPRDWITVATYIGPDRRRFNTGDYKGPRKRRSEAAGAQQVALEEAVRLLKASLELFDQDAAGMLQTVMQQMAVIVPACKTVKDPRFTQAVSVIVHDLRNKALSKESLEPQVALMVASLGGQKPSDKQWATKLFNEADEPAARATAVA